MDLIERYLQQVRFWLPAGHEDLVAEWAEDLRCQADEAEARLGRPLTEADTAELLKRLGSPLEAAGRIVPASPWLDPALTMLYRFVLKVVLLYALPAVFAVLALPAALLSRHPLAEVAGAMESFVNSEVYALGVVTLVFLALQHFRPRLLAQWDPRRLPPLSLPRGLKPVPRASSVAEIIFGLLFAGWWIEAGARLPVAWSSRLGAIPPTGPLWAELRGIWFAPILVLALANVAVAALCLARPHLSRFRLAWGALSNGAMAGICGAALASQDPGLQAGIRLLAKPGAWIPGADPVSFLFQQGLTLLLAGMCVGTAIGAVVQGIRFLASLAGEARETA